MASDFFEELLVNPTLLTIARQRGNLDRGGLRHVIVGYGNFNQVILNEEAGQRMIKTDAVDLCTQAFGDTANPGLLLIMGATASMVRWPETLCRQLADSGLYVIRYDNRDTGASTSYPLCSAVHGCGPV